MCECEEEARGANIGDFLEADWHALEPVSDGMGAPGDSWWILPSGDILDHDGGGLECLQQNSCENHTVLLQST